MHVSIHIHVRVYMSMYRHFRVYVQRSLEQLLQKKYPAAHEAVQANRHCTFGPVCGPQPR